MYPNLYFALKDIFNIEPWGFTRYINSFGFFVSISFACAAITLFWELKRKKALGYFTPSTKTITIGEAPKPLDLLWQFIPGFLLGFKVLGLFLNKDQSINAQDYIFSMQGNVLMGLLLGGLLAGLRFWEVNKQKLDKPVTKTVQIWPQDRIGDYVVLAGVFGFLGAKIFHNLENIEATKRIIEQEGLKGLLAFDGLAFYGGLICAAAAILYYLYKKKISMRHFIDAVAPGLILAYAVGRIGCQVSGDGDWGFYNKAYMVDTANQQIVEAQPQVYDSVVKANSVYFDKHIKELGKIPVASFKKPGFLGFLPNWMFAYQYPNNVGNTGIPIAGCDQQDYCNYLPVPVFPTPFYETLMGLCIFALLWYLRKKITTPGVLFSLYLMFNGLERFLIEKIRVNDVYHIFGFTPSQAQVIAVVLFILGLGLFFFFKKTKPSKPLTT
jgi:phosphatidylglycerol---prolipoprotein diacylglyceryl transferase